MQESGMGVVLFALEEIDDPMRVALLRAHGLALAAEAALHAVRVISPRDEGGSPRASTLVELFTAERELRQVCRELLPEALGADRLRVSAGDFTREVAASASRDRADLVVVPDSPTAGRRAAQLARQARVPVLVARTRRPQGAVIGTTDLEHRRYPEIRRANEVASWLEAPLMVFHSPRRAARSGW